MLKALMERRAALKASLEALHKAAVGENGEARSFTDAETTEFDNGVTELRKLDERISEVQAAEVREANAARHHVESGTANDEQRTAPVVVNEPDIYVKGGANSYFRDLFKVTTDRDSDAAERLRRHAARMSETRAVGNTNAAGGSGGEFAPPAWMTNEWINILRPARITANLFAHEDVPFGISSLNYPKLLTGTTVALQSTQNSALASTDPTTGFIQTGFATIGGKNVISQQLIDQGRNFDAVMTADLGAAYAQQVGTQVFTGTGTGSGTNAVINGLGAAVVGTTQTWTQAAPTTTGFYGQTGSMLSQFLTKRLAAPSCWVMHPRRWYWLESAVDSSGRPLVVPSGNAYNPLAVESNVVPMGQVGYFHGLPVVIDPLVPITVGAGTNQDLVYLLKTDDLVLLESGPRTEVFREPYADSLGVLIRLYGYVATILNRHTESIAVLTGTGLTPPTFAS